MVEMSARAGEAFKDATATGEPLVALVTHADVAKAILAQSLGMALDEFQRIVLSPASVSVIDASSTPRVWAMNSLSGPLAELIPFGGHADR